VFPTADRQITAKKIFLMHLHSFNDLFLFSRVANETDAFKIFYICINYK